MPIVAVPEALSKGELDGVVTSWVALPAIKLDTMVKYHTTLDPGSPWPFSIAFLLAMNSDTYRGLPDDLKQVIRANSGAEPSAWVGRVYDEASAVAARSAADRGAKIDVLSREELAKWKPPAQGVTDAWLADLDKRGWNGKELLESAHAALAQYDPAK
jgi:TRAP-type C4-dicarboxylate transport system substrate-binding protein